MTACRRWAPLLFPLLAAAACVPTPPEADGGVDPRPEPLYAEGCAPGTMPLLGSADCVSAGWHDCPAGFAADPSGWGCREVLPTAPCTGATREALGQSTCAPVGDCSAPFPPAAATFFVDPNATVDGTHFKTIIDALAAAPANATIAVEAGTYVGMLSLTRPVKLVGRCAAQVIVQSDGSRNAGVLVSGTTGTVEVRGVTLQGHVAAAYVDYGSTLRLADSVVEGNREIGVYLNRSSKLMLERSVVRGTLAASNGMFGFGAYAENGSTLEATDSALVDNRYADVFLVNPGTHVPPRATLTGCVLARTWSAGDGRGVFMQKGTLLTATGTAFVGHREIALSLEGAGTTASLTDCVVRDTTPNGRGVGGSAVQVETGAQLTLSRCGVVGNTGVAVQLFDATTRGTVTDSVVQSTHFTAQGTYGRAVAATLGAQLTVSQSALVDNGDVSAFASEAGTHLVLDASVIRDTRATSVGGFGGGLEVSKGASAEVSRSALLSTRDLGMHLVDPGSALTATDTLVLDTASQTAPDPVPAFGEGLFLRDGTAQLTRVVVRRSAAVGMVFSSVGAVVDDCFIADNVVGLQVQGTSALREVTAPDALQPNDVQVAQSTRFQGNQTRLGAGELPLPAVLPP